MKKSLLSLTAVLLNIACTDEATECRNLYDAEQFSEALTVCEKACNMNNGNGCLTIGELYRNGQGVKQDYQQAKIYFEYNFPNCIAHYRLLC